MNLGRLTLAVALATSLATASHGKEAPPIPCGGTASIGVAHMSEGGVIVLRLRSLPPGPIAEGELHYAPGDRDYQDIKAHLGGIAPGEFKPVRPWC